MIDVKRDNKSEDNWIVTKTDSEGFHCQLNLTLDEMNQIVNYWINKIL